MDQNESDGAWYCVYGSVHYYVVGYLSFTKKKLIRPKQLKYF